MQIEVNGSAYQVPDEPDRPLLWVVRDELGLTGTKYGCGIGICGTCDVLLNGNVVRSCRTPLSVAGGKSVLTIEGLAHGGVLHPVQQAFVEEQVLQCGWCMSGQMIRAVALLEANPTPSDDQIVSAMSRNLCRCGAYGRIKRAIARASSQMSAEMPGPTTAEPGPVTAVPEAVAAVPRAVAGGRTKSEEASAAVEGSRG